MITFMHRSVENGEEKRERDISFIREELSAHTIDNRGDECGEDDGGSHSQNLSSLSSSYLSFRVTNDALNQPTLAFLFKKSDLVHTLGSQN